MITLAFAQMMYYIVVCLEHYGGEDGLNLAARSQRRVRLELAQRSHVLLRVLAPCSLIVALFLLQRSTARFGRVILGIRENETRMEAIGFPTFRYKLVCFAIAGGLARTRRRAASPIRTAS